MKNDAIELRILRYVEDEWKNKDYILEIVTALPLSQIFDLICKLLRSVDSEDFRATALFIQDIISLAEHGIPDFKPFYDAYTGSEIIAILEQSILSDNYFIRSQAISTLGQTSGYTSGDILIRAFNLFRDTDPLLLDRLTSQIRYFEVANVDSCVEFIIHSHNYLTRWAIVESLREAIQDEIPQWVEVLRQDRHELVRTEAEYEYQSKIKSLQTPILSKAEQRQRAKDIKKIKPVISFWDVRFLFEKHLLYNGVNQYTVHELESFVDRLWDERRSADSRSTIR
jgi:hypothetical protein